MQQASYIRELVHSLSQHGSNITLKKCYEWTSVTSSNRRANGPIKQLFDNIHSCTVKIVGCCKSLHGYSSLTNLKVDVNKDVCGGVGGWGGECKVLGAKAQMFNMLNPGGC